MHILRWLLFLPMSLICSAVFFVVVVAAANSASKYFGDSDGFLLGEITMGVLASVIAGSETIKIAVAIAPNFKRIVAVITWIICVSVAVALIRWAHHTNDIALQICVWVAAILYAISSFVIAALCVLGQEK